MENEKSNVERVHGDGGTLLLKLKEDCYLTLFRGYYWCTLRGLSDNAGQGIVGLIRTENYLYPGSYKKLSMLHIFMLWLAMQECGNKIEEFRTAPEEIVDEFFYESISNFQSDFMESRSECSTAVQLKNFSTSVEDINIESFADVKDVRHYKKKMPLAYIGLPPVEAKPYYFGVYTTMGDYIVKQPNEYNEKCRAAAEKLLRDSAYTIPDMVLGTLSMCGIHADTFGFHASGPVIKLEFPRKVTSSWKDVRRIYDP